MEYQQSSRQKAPLITSYNYIVLEFRIKKMEHQQSSGSGRDNNFLENVVMFMSLTELYTTGKAGARTLIGGGGCIFIYSGYARLVSFVIKLISKEISRA